jgi:hypothetical protein
MNRVLARKIFPQVLALSAAVALCGAVALAQDTPASTSSSAAAGARSDGQIEMDVVHALDSSRALKNDLITAATIQSEVTLSGTVTSESSKELAESITSRVPGVTKVNNNLTVGDPKAAAAANNMETADSQPEDGQAAPAPASAQVAAPDVNNGPQPPTGQYQNQGQYPNGQYPDQNQQAPPPMRRRYAQQAPPPAYETPKGPVTIPQGTLLQLRSNEPLASKRAKDGEPVQFTVIQDVALGGVLAIPRGATVHGVVTDVKRAGQLSGSPELALKLTSLDLGGQSYPIETDQFKVKGPNKAGQTAGNAIGGGILGTIIGCAAGRGVGCAIGAGAGVAAGTAASAASSGPGVWIPAEARVDFHLATPLTVTPVNAQEAARLAQGLYPGGPSLYRRGYGYGRPYYAGYGSPYPPVYFRPYYAVGGYYYWR